MMSDKIYTVYIHRVPNGKIYIGTTSQKPYLRWHGGSGYARQPEFYNDIIAYGWNNIVHEIYGVYSTKEEAQDVERTLIQKYSDCCYNVKGRSTTRSAEYQHYYKWRKKHKRNNTEDI